MIKSTNRQMLKNSLPPAILLSLLLLLAMFSPGLAVESLPTPAPEDAHYIASQIYPPSGERVPLSECTSKVCGQWQELIREQLMQGKNEQQIKDYFVEQYGRRVLAKPPLIGINWLVYILPTLSSLLVVFFVYRTLYKRNKAPGSTDQNDHTPDDNFEGLFEEQVQDYQKHYHEKQDD